MPFPYNIIWGRDTALPSPTLLLGIWIKSSNKAEKIWHLSV